MPPAVPFLVRLSEVRLYSRLGQRIAQTFDAPRSFTRQAPNLFGAQIGKVVQQNYVAKRTMQAHRATL